VGAAVPTARSARGRVALAHGGLRRASACPPAHARSRRCRPPGIVRHASMSPDSVPVELEGAPPGLLHMSQRSERDAGLSVHLTDAHRTLLTTWVRAGTTPPRVARRAHVVLLAAGGLTPHAVADPPGISPWTAVPWARRYVQGGPDAPWHEAPGRGRRPSIDPNAASRARAPGDASLERRPMVHPPGPSGDRSRLRAGAAAGGQPVVAARLSPCRPLRHPAARSAPGA
jgi:hypothetical protein